MSTVSISELGEFVAVVYQELQEIEKLQLQVGEDIAKLLFEQVRLAEKSKALLLVIGMAVSMCGVLRGTTLRISRASNV